MKSLGGSDSSRRFGFWFPRSAWEPACPDALRRAGRRRASKTVRSHAERGNEGNQGLAFRIQRSESSIHPSSLILHLSFQSPHPSPLPKGEGIAAPRRGAILVVIVVCFVVAATLFVLLARSAISLRQADETHYWSLQAQWLGEAALERAAARLATDAKYDGETWTVPGKELAGNQGGTVRIEVKKDADHPGRRTVRVEAVYPDDPVHCCRWEKQVVMETSHG